MRGTHPFPAGRRGFGIDRPNHTSERPSPRRFERISVEKAEILVRTDAVAWSRQAVLAYGSLYHAALDSADRALHGRGRVPVLTNPEGTGPPWVVRRYFRGGFMRPLGDRFLRTGRPRSFVEAETSAQLEELGFATPRVVAAAVYRAGVVYRADLVTEFVPHVSTLAGVLVGTHDHSGAVRDGVTRRQALTCTAELIQRMSKSGIRHRDLNAQNILIARDASRVHAILVDLDRCGVAGPHRPVEAGTLRRRLARSIRKLGRTPAWPCDEGEKPLTHEEIKRLLHRIGEEEVS